MALTVSTAAFVSANAFVAGILDNGVTPRLYTANAFSGGSTPAPPTSATPGVPANSPMVGLPQVQSVALITAGDGVQNVQVGQVRLTLVPNAADTLLASSPLELVLSPNALVIVASTSTG